MTASNQRIKMHRLSPVRFTNLCETHREEVLRFFKFQAKAVPDRVVVRATRLVDPMCYTSIVDDFIGIDQSNYLSVMALMKILEPE